MNNYLGKKALKNRIWEKPVSIIFGLFALFFLWVAFDLLIGDSNIGAAIVGLVFTVPLIYGTIAPLRTRALRNKAKTISEQLVKIPYEEISYRKLEAIIQINKLIPTLDLLIKKNYLINLHVDPLHKTVMLLDKKNTTPTAKQKTSLSSKDYVSLNCPHCGGDNLIPRERIIACQYCGSLITADKSTAEK